MSCKFLNSFVGWLNLSLSLILRNIQAIQSLQNCTISTCSIILNIFKGTYFWLHRNLCNFNWETMKFLILLTVFISAVRATVDVNRMVEDRTIICNFFGNSRCATACRYALRNASLKVSKWNYYSSGALCTASCVYDCGFFRTGTVLCSVANPTGCTTGTSSTSTGGVSVTVG